MGNRDGGPFPETVPGQHDQVVAEAEALVRAKFLPDLADAILSAEPQLFVGLKVIPGRSMGYDGMILGHSLWFVRDKEIDAVAAVGTIATAIDGFSTPVGFAATLLIALAGVLKKAADKHVELGDRDAALLLYLKHHRAQTTQEIVGGLNEIRATTSFTWNERDLLEQLHRLQNVHLADGTLEALVTQASDGRWRTNGL
jgi:hypothetical protein